MTYYPRVPGNYFVEVIERGFQCKGLSQIITINKTPDAPILYNSRKPLCTGQSDTLRISFTQDRISSYDWYGESSKSKLAIGNQYITNVSGLYSSRAFAINGCISDYSKPINVSINKSVKPKLTYLGNSVSGGITLCNPTAVDLSVRVDSIDLLSTQWFINNTIKPTTTATINYKTATGFVGKIYVKTISTGTLCPAMDSVAIDLVDQKPTSIATTGDFCIGKSVILSSTITNGTKYIWQKDGVIIPTATGKNLDISSNGTYNLEVQIANNACSKTAIYIATFNALPNKPSISGKSEIISGEKIILNATSDTPQPKYQWYNGGFEIANTPTITITDSGKYQVIVSNSFNCKSSISSVYAVNKINKDTIVPITNPTADIAGGGILGSEIIITVSPKGSSAPWRVIVEIKYDSSGIVKNLDDYYSINTIPFSYRSKRAGTYRIKSVNDNTEGNGVAYVYITDRDSSEVFVWNAVSPNGDGKNDLFEIEIPKRLANKTAQIVIFDREGTRLADESINIGTVLPLNAAQDMYVYLWNCKNPSGELLTPGTYFFSFKVTDFEKDKRASKSGFIEVRR